MSGQAGQPTWLWGTNDGQNAYVYNPSNFNVHSVDGYHLNQDVRIYGLADIRGPDN